jgi:hypothetical protein
MGLDGTRRATSATLCSWHVQLACVEHYKGIRWSGKAKEGKGREGKEREGNVAVTCLQAQHLIHGLGGVVKFHFILILNLG